MHMHRRRRRGAFFALPNPADVFGEGRAAVHYSLFVYTAPGVYMRGDDTAAPTPPIVARGIPTMTTWTRSSRSHIIFSFSFFFQTVSVDGRSWVRGYVREVCRGIRGSRE